MKIIFTEGHKAEYGFMGYGQVLRMENYNRARERYPEIKPFSNKFRFRIGLSTNEVYFHKYESSLKSICRKIKRMNLSKGTVIFVHNWYIGYANVYIIV